MVPAFQEGCEDDDSLFGSPPPSPLARGRSPSPASASSSASPGVLQGSSFGSTAQNVGTIALPGSHMHSELSINPIAASLSLPGSSCIPGLPQSLPSSEPHSRQSSVGRHETTPKTYSVPLSDPDSSKTRRRPVPSNKRVSKRKVKEPTRPPPPPPIALPDPSQPPPAHFLRSQQALLGHAGLVARVKPYQLTMNGTPRGASPSNPIVLDDREAETTEQPPIGRSHSNRITSVNQSEFPQPTHQEIVQMMIKQKDVFPVLQNILKLLTAGALGGRAVAPTPIRSNSQATKRAQNNRLFQPPPKRRKLNRVPAGAADWDVPYPFREGEGPEAYYQTWLQDRGRQLVSQLINLVKIAAQKAAARKHVEELAKKRTLPESAGGVDDEASQRQGGKGANHYREMNDSQGSLAPTKQAAPRVEAEGTSTSEHVDMVSASGAESEPAQSTNATSSSASFDDLFSALLAAPDFSSAMSANLGCSSSNRSDPPGSSSGNNSSTVTPSESDGHMEQCLIDSWMNILQTFPLQEAGAYAQGVSSHDQHSLDSLLGFNSNETLSSFTSPTSGDSSSFSTTPNLDNQAAQTFGSLSLDHLGGLDLALNLFPGGVSTPESFGSDPSVSTSALPGVDVKFDLAPSLRDSVQEPGRVDQTQQVAGDQSSSVSSSFAGILIDPQLLVPSQPDFGALIPPSSNAAQIVLAQSQDGVSPCSSLASSSPCEPVTPSSATWDMAPNSAVDETFDFDGGKHMSISHQQEAVKSVVSHSASDDRGSKTPSKPDSRATLRTTPATSRQNVQSSPNASVSSAPTQPPGVFQVLRVADLEPQPKLAPKLNKTDVLKRAEAKREELRAELEQVKVKLWETTIEHGALVHLMRLCPDHDQVESASANS